MEVFNPILTSNTLPRYLKTTQTRTKHCGGKSNARCFCKVVSILLQPRLGSWAPARLEKEYRSMTVAEGTGVLPGAWGMKLAAAKRLEPGAGCQSERHPSRVKLRVQVNPPAAAAGQKLG